ncbi:MAG TPA: glycerol-3-phosphate 1-O-acyltransferase PlsY [Thermoanaerobaculia bacterium]|nr:glycerol-3-phosphate 1-O-acyltransferase PlsY [Thermoanaerobaculia bacterium]
MSRWLPLVLAAYLVGSISFSYLVVRVLTGRDVRAEGSGNAGATNALRVAGKGAGAAALLLDVAKGAGAVAAARLLGAPPVVVAVTAAAVVVGHVWPLFLDLRGGKGVATAAGALGVLAPVPSLLAAVVFLAVVGVTRFVSLGSMLGVASFPLFVFLSQRLGWEEHDPAFVAGSVLVPALVLFKHRSNARRLLAGSERRLGERAPSGEREG